MNTSPLASATFASLLGTALAFSPCAYAQTVVPLKEAKLNIEHNFTDEDTGFQGAIDSEGWKELTVTGPPRNCAVIFSNPILEPVNVSVPLILLRLGMRRPGSI